MCRVLRGPTRRPGAAPRGSGSGSERRRWSVASQRPHL